MSIGTKDAESGAVPRGAEIGPQKEFVTVEIAGQRFGIPVLVVQDVLGPCRITRIPLSSPEVAGALNLRGRIVTAIDMRTMLGLPRRDDGESGMNVVIDRGSELYSLIVDTVGEVLSLPMSTYERNPPTLDPKWAGISDGIFRLTEGLLVVLDVDRLLSLDKAAA